jgi:hypothetical protein
MIHDPEEEHDCFSDNTHASLFFDALGIRNVYLGIITGHIKFEGSDGLDNRGNGKESKAVTGAEAH